MKAAWGLWSMAAVTALVLTPIATASATQVPSTELVSISTSGDQGNRSVVPPVAVSLHGRYVAFTSEADNLIAHDENGDVDDVFIRDRVSGRTELVSVSTGGDQAGGVSFSPSVSATGRYVAFGSLASNLVPHDTNARDDVFVRDRVTHTTRRISVNNGGGQANENSDSPVITPDGRYVAFRSLAGNLVSGDTNRRDDIFVRDRLSKSTERISVSGMGNQGNGESFAPAISADGRYVAFLSWASNLVAGDTNHVIDVFVRDRLAGTTERVNVSNAGAQGDDTSYGDSIGLSADARYVAFTSSAANLVPGDTNQHADVFVRDRIADTTERVSVSAAGVQGNGDSVEPAISADGRRVSFTSDAANLVGGDNNDVSDVFAHDLPTGTTTRQSVASGGMQSNGFSWMSNMSGDGLHIAFISAGSNLVPVDANASPDVFVRNLG